MASLSPFPRCCVYFLLDFGFLTLGYWLLRLLHWPACSCSLLSWTHSLNWCWGFEIFYLLTPPVTQNRINRISVFILSELTGGYSTLKSSIELNWSNWPFSLESTSNSLALLKMQSKEWSFNHNNTCNISWMPRTSPTHTTVRTRNLSMSLSESPCRDPV